MPDPPTPPTLTRRERDVLLLLAAGHANQQIADELFISINTVKRHITNLFAKLGATSRSEAVATARDLQLL
jgi:DNA-binding CsgD family transcriptional regulator